MVLHPGAFFPAFWVMLSLEQVKNKSFENKSLFIYAFAYFNRILLSSAQEACYKLWLASLASGSASLLQASCKPLASLSSAFCKQFHMS